VGYGLYAIACLSCAALVFRSASPADSTSTPVEVGPSVSGGDRALWIALAACGVVVLLAATNQVSKDVAVIPLLWVLPLSLYLISFIVAFGLPNWYHRGLWAPVMVLSIIGVVYLLHQDYADVEVHLYIQIFIYSAAVFGCCMVCHGELFRLRPHESRLTSYYFLVSVGGALGGVFVNLVAPYIFKGYWEFHASLVATVLMFWIAVSRDKELPLPRSWRVPISGAWLAAATLLVYFLGLHVREQQDEAIVTTRSFYGVLRVYEIDIGTTDHIRYLYHGRSNHGSQYLHASRGKSPASYYGSESGIGLAMVARREELTPSRGMPVGIIGLGTANLAAYSEPLDHFRFDELNPDVARIASAYFTYLEDSRGETKIVLGDARISLEQELERGEAQNFDLLVVDAFSGDAIPVHLLTREAFELYFQHLHPEGVLAVHISNFHFDLRPVVSALAAAIGKHSVWVENYGSDDEEESDWALVTGNEHLAEELLSTGEPLPEGDPRVFLWTDDYANVLSAIWIDD